MAAARAELYYEKSIGMNFNFLDVPLFGLFPPLTRSAHEIKKKRGLHSWLSQIIIIIIDTARAQSDSIKILRHIRNYWHIICSVTGKVI